MLLLLLSPRRFYYLCPNPAGLINSTANNNGNQEGQPALPGPIPFPSPARWPGRLLPLLTWHALTVLLSADLAAAAAR